MTHNSTLPLIFIFSSDSANPTRYIFIDDFCGDDAEMNVYQTLEIQANGVGQTASFSIEAFTFNGGAGDLFLHCTARVCDSSYEVCLPTCGNARKRRSTSAGDTPITLGPIRINALEQRVIH